jgi:CRAL/TRIO domain
VVYLANFQIDFILRNCHLPSTIEGWTVILDFTNVGITQIPKTLLQGLITAMSRNYRGRMFRMFMVHVGWLVRGLYKVVRPMLDEFTATKINIYGDNDFEQDILKVVDAKNLEKKYGGELPDKIGDYFPPELI